MCLAVLPDLVLLSQPNSGTYIWQIQRLGRLFRDRLHILSHSLWKPCMHPSRCHRDHHRYPICRPLPGCPDRYIDTTTPDTFRFVEVGQFNHPSVEFRALRSTESKELLLRQLILRQRFLQFLVSHQSLQNLSRIVVQRNNGEAFAGSSRCS